MSGSSAAEAAARRSLSHSHEKLLVALWRYVTAGIVIEGATMKA